jgi:hypothetical protein
MTMATGKGPSMEGMTEQAEKEEQQTEGKAVHPGTFI